jgi:hypothetical protein
VGKSIAKAIAEIMLNPLPAVAVPQQVQHPSLFSHFATVAQE